VPKRAVVWKQDGSGRVHTPFEPLVLAATLSLLPVLIIEADTTSDGCLTFAEVANWVIWALFLTELVAVLVFAKRKRAALRAHWLDVAIVVLTVPLLGKALAWLRLARFIRLARFGVIISRALVHLEFARGSSVWALSSSPRRGWTQWTTAERDLLEVGP